MRTMLLYCKKAIKEYESAIGKMNETVANTDKQQNFESEDFVIIQRKEASFARYILSFIYLFLLKLCSSKFAICTLGYNDLIARPH